MRRCLGKCYDGLHVQIEQPSLVRQSFAKMNRSVAE